MPEDEVLEELVTFLVEVLVVDFAIDFSLRSLSAAAATSCAFLFFLLEGEDEMEEDVGPQASKPGRD